MQQLQGVVPVTFADKPCKFIDIAFIDSSAFQV